MNRHEIDSFRHATKADWAEVAQKELKGQDPYQQLTRTVENINILPYYDDSDIKAIDHNILLPASSPNYGPREWVNAPAVTVEEEKSANSLALEHLNFGADGVLFKLKSEVDLNALLKDIELPYCSVSFSTQSSTSNLASDFEQYTRQCNYDPSLISGAILAESLPDLDTLKLDGSLPNYFRMGKIVSRGNTVASFTKELVALIKWLDGTEKKSDLKRILESFAFSFDIGTDFFLEIAKLKSFRILWRRIAFAYGVNYPTDPLLHANCLPWSNEDFSPNENMLKNTTAAMAAVLGGADIITVEPDNDQPFKSRIARNVSSILREESNLSAVSDATAGSFYLEALIEQITNTTWTEFVNQVNP